MATKTIQRQYLPTFCITFLSKARPMIISTRISWSQSFLFLYLLLQIVKKDGLTLSFAFSIKSPPLLLPTRKQSTTLLATTTTTTTTNNDVARVAVCTGHLCECQDEGGNGSDILQKLQDLNIDCDVDDAPCLGCCGMGAMVWIEYKDGTDQIVAGMEETMEGLGLVS
mmetsp:Transcript_23828/g.33442  ORF Transcript_23828/g.33442 Transcript_23828/m.33442 type:complete len:168 (+) Transcript_23828:50-553(+)